MPDSRISDLTAATSVGTSDLFVLEQNSTAKKLTGQTLINNLLTALNGHGGISSITWTTSGTSGDGQYHNGTIHYADNSTSTFQIRDGFKGDSGDDAHVYFKYASRQPTSNSDMSDTPDKWIGVYSGASATMPSDFGAYTWYEWKGETGDASEVTDTSVLYQVGDEDGNEPTGIWTPLSNISNLDGGKYLWSKTVTTFNGTTDVVVYAKSRQGVDGSGTAGTATPLADSGSGAVGTSTAFAREDHVHPATATNLTVGTASTNNIQVNSSSITNLNRYSAKRVGNVCIFSFVATTAATTANQVLFTVASGLRPSEQIDFVMLSSFGGAMAGQLTTAGLINSYQAISTANGTIRGEVIWVIG